MKRANRALHLERTYKSPTTSLEGIFVVSVDQRQTGIIYNVLTYRKIYQGLGLSREQSVGGRTLPRVRRIEDLLTRDLRVLKSSEPQVDRTMRQ